MTRTSQQIRQTTEDIKSELKIRLGQRIDALFEQLPENSSLAEIEKTLLKEAPKLTSELFQALVDRQDFSPYPRTQQARRTAAQRTQKKQN
jgi:hypothetical protein